MDVITVGVGLAKNAFSMHGVGAQGKAVLRALLSDSGLVMP